MGVVRKTSWVERLRETFPGVEPWFCERGEGRYSDVAAEFADQVAAMDSIHARRSQMEEFLGACGSPIEAALGGALVTEFFRFHGDAIAVIAKLGDEKAPFYFDFVQCAGDKTIESVRRKAGHPLTTVVIQPQSRMGRYRADFLLSFDVTHPVWMGGDDWRTIEFHQTAVIECDGHDFHERTKQQASHDRKRDRVLQSEGHMVLRFPGSVIWANPYDCAAEVVTTMEKASDAALQREEAREQ